MKQLNKTPDKILNLWRWRTTSDRKDHMVYFGSMIYINVGWPVTRTIRRKLYPPTSFGKNNI